MDTTFDFATQIVNSRLKLKTHYFQRITFITTNLYIYYKR